MFRRALPAVLVVATAGCAAQPAEESAPIAVSQTSTAVPVAPLTSGPPRGPSDQMKATSWVVGTVTKGGTGPCYGLQTDEGVDYALYSTAGTALTKGLRMRVDTRPTKLRIYCGPGRLVEMVTAEPVR